MKDNPMSNDTHPQWCTQQHEPDDSIQLCTGTGRGFITPSGGVAKARPERITFRAARGKPEPYIAVYGMRSSQAPSPDRPFRMKIPAADAGPLTSLLRVLSGASREQFAELEEGIRAAQAAITGNEPEAGQ
jgi:hypothetical protein